jgi:hypothetical protein
MRLTPENLNGVKALGIEMIRQAVIDVRSGDPVRRAFGMAYLSSQHCAEVLDEFGVNAAFAIRRAVEGSGK